MIIKKKVQKNITKKKLKNKIVEISINSFKKNTIITLSNICKDTTQNYQYSTKSYPLKMKKKNNIFILNKISYKLVNKLKKLKVTKVIISLKGLGLGRYAVINIIRKHFKIFLIKDKTFIPFNGCRPPKKKRK